jgi:S-formylglutathione hydrolase FrmB
MKLTLVRAVGVASLALLVTLEAAGQTAAPPAHIPDWIHRSMSWIEPDQNVPTGAQYKTFHSKTINTDVSYVVYLPPNYERDTGTRYPVLYYLHGSGGTSVNGAQQVVRTLDKAIRAGRVAPMIAIFVNGMRGNTAYCDSRDGKWPVETVIIKDLIPYVDATYRTLPSRESRAIEGFSMGSFGAAHLGFKYPEEFGVICIVAAALFGPHTGPGLDMAWGVLFPSPSAMGGDMAYWKANDPFELVKKNADALRDRTLIRIVTHDFETMKNSQAIRSEELHELMVQLMIPHAFYFLMNVKVHNAQQVWDTMGDNAFSFFSSALPRWQTYHPVASQQ